MGSDERLGGFAPTSVEPEPGGPAGGSELVRALLLQVAIGDRSALAELYDLTVARVYGLISATVPEPDRAEALIDVYVLLWRTSPRGTPRPEPEDWVADALAAAAPQAERPVPPLRRRRGR